MLEDYWQSLAAGSESLVERSQSLFEPARKFLVGAGKTIGQGLMQLALATFVGFFFYRDGEVVTAGLIKAMDRLAGGLGRELLHTVHSTVTGVVRGIFGTALVQAIVALVGFLIAGIPAAFLLAAAIFFLSIIPIGPPLVWGGATLWLFYEGQTGWSIFMGLWGLLAISSVDNFVRPFLISRNSDLPLLLIVLGVLGGVSAFGFIGIFIGPPVLAVGLALAKLWILHANEETGTRSNLAEPDQAPATAETGVTVERSTR
jgi:predicted PurR-regulated permease PerM